MFSFRFPVVKVAEPVAWNLIVLPPARPPVPRCRRALLWTGQGVPSKTFHISVSRHMRILPGICSCPSAAY